MARSRNDPADSFSYTELALAGDINKSAFQFLDRTGLLPGGRGIRDFKRVATIGAFMAAGVPLVLSGRIASAISVEFDNGEPPSGLKEIAEEMATAEELGMLPAEPNDLWYHRLLVCERERWMREATASAKKVAMESVPPFHYWEYVARERSRTGYYAGLIPAIPSDIRIEICDRRHVFMWPTSRLKSFGQDRAEERAFREKHPRRPRDLEALEIGEPGFVGWIEGWERDAEMRFRHVSEQIQLSPADEPHRSRIARLKAELGEAKYQDWYSANADEQWRANAARLQAVSQEVLGNTVGKLTINVSLAARRALDRVAEHRAARRDTKALT
jgi:hypothetical protein